MWAATSSQATAQSTHKRHKNAWLSTVTYRSRATALLTELQLKELAEAAQARNRSEGITGMVIYDNGRFLQWLEGPDDAISRVMNSIKNDTRHTDLEILGTEKTPVRMFAGWDLNFKAKPMNAGRKAEAQGFAKDQVAQNTLIPDLDLALSAGSAGVRPSDGNQKALELACLLIATDPVKASRLIQELAGQTVTSKELFERVIEPAARSLGDLWSEDRCTEFDVTIGLCRLQTAVRGICYELVSASIPDFDSRTVFVAPQPGEPHMLCAALDSEIFWQAGWRTRCEFPATDKELQDVLANEWFDALDLSLSASFRHEHWLPRVARTVAAARTASRNPALVVVIGGRLFTEQPGIATSVGADTCFDSSIHVVDAISRVFEQRRRA